MSGYNFEGQNLQDGTTLRTFKHLSMLKFGAHTNDLYTIIIKFINFGLTIVSFPPPLRVVSIYRCRLLLL